MVKTQPSNAGERGFSPGWGTKIPHVPGQLSLSATTTELIHCGVHAPQLGRSLHGKVPTCCSEDWTHPEINKLYV